MENSYNYEEIKEFALNFDTHNNTKEQVQKLKNIMVQLGFTWNECNCKSLTNDLHTKLLSWLKRNKDGMLRYSIQRGVLFWCEGQLVCFATLTNQLAEMVKEKMPQEYEKYIKEILPKEEPTEVTLFSNTTNATNSTNADNDEVEKALARKQTKRKISNKVK